MEDNQTGGNGTPDLNAGLSQGSNKDPMIDLANVDGVEDLIPQEMKDIYYKDIAPEEDPNKKDDEPGQDDPPEDQLGLILEDDKKTTPQAKDDDPAGKDDEGDLSEEEIQELLGEKKQETPAEDVKPFWEEDEVYQELSQYVDSEQLNKLLTKVADTKATENTQFTTDLQSKLTTSESSVKTLTEEVTRLKEIEKNAIFDMHPDTQEKFIKPMSSAIEEIGRVLRIEGVDVPINKIANAENINDLQKLLTDANISDEGLKTISSNYRSYKEIAFEHQKAKQAVSQSLPQLLKTQVDEKTANLIMNDALSSIVDSNPDEFKFITNAMAEGVDKHPEALEVLGQAKGHFNAMLKAIGSPQDYAKNSEFLTKLAKYTINNARNVHALKNTSEQAKELEETQAKLEKVTAFAKKLYESSKGLSSNGRAALPVTGKGKKKDTSAEDAQTFKDFLKNDKGLKDLVPVIDL